MATLQQQRQAIAAGVSAGRAATGQAARQATGQSLIEQRTGKSVASDINRLTNPQPARRTLRPVAPVGALPASKGRGVYKPPASTGTAGIASPLVEGVSGEGASLAREYYAGITLTSSDGLISLDVEPLKKLTMRDANGGPVVLEFAEP